MQAVTARSQEAQSTNHLQTQPPSTLTDAKVKKFALIFFDAFLFVTGYTLLHVGPMAALFLALPTFVFAGLVAWAITKIKDYQDPGALAKYREKAEKQTFDQVVKDHSLQNILRYDILTKEAFVEKANAFFGTYSKLMPLVRAYDAVVRSLQNNLVQATDIIPKLTRPGSLLTNLEENMTLDGKNLETVLKEYDVGLLVEHGVATKKLQELKVAWSRAEKDLPISVAKERARYTEQLKIMVDAFTQYLNANSDNGPHFGYLHQRIQEATSHPSASYWFAQLEKIDLSSFGHFEESAPIIGVFNQFKQDYKQAHERHHAILKQLINNKYKSQEQLSADYQKSYNDIWPLG
jgi:hypothetical protein